MDSLLTCLPCPHVRSIVVSTVQERRTRISEKLRKLQELVPNMDKVTDLTSLSLLIIL